MEIFPKLYNSCGLDFGPGARRFVADTSSSANPIEVPPEKFKLTSRNSRKAAQIWATRLTPEMVDHIRTGTGPEADRFYSASDWVLDKG
jgi:hypothetical protein